MSRPKQARAAAAAGRSSAVPRQEQKRGGPASAAPPELNYGGRVHANALQDATLSDMARRIPAALGRTFRLAWSVDRRMVVTVLVCQVLSGVGTAVMLAAVAQAMGPLFGSGDAASGLREAWPALVAAGVAVSIGSTAWIVADWATRRLNPQVASAADLTMVDLHMRVELSAYDEEGFTDRSQAAEIGAMRAVDLAEDAKNMTNGLVQLLSAATVLTVLHPVLLAVLLLSVVPRGIGGVIAARIDYRVFEASVSARNTRGMMRWFLTTPTLADELRANTMRPYLHFWYRTMCDRVEGRALAAAPLYLRVNAVALSLGGVFTAGMWGALAALVLSGGMTLAIAGTAVVASQTAGRSLATVIRYGAAMFHHGLYLDDYHHFLLRARELTTRRGIRTPPAPAEIRLTEATFSYPKRATPALHPVSLTLRRGEVIALVGENGAGKSTLVRLLTGLTLPTSGSVCWDGTDLTEADADALWRHVGLVPQQNGHWPLAARENIDLGQPRAQGDDLVWQAAEQVGMAEALRELPDGLDTLLARSLWGGHELSGGQWQRLACARAMHRRPGFLILDEPTSEMDARGEHQIFAALRAMAPERITLVVTHRLDNVRMADRIIVLDRGRIQEEGTFDQLAHAGGLFAELYALSQDR